MNVTANEYDAAPRIPPRALRAYVEASGWQHVEDYGDKGNIYSLDDRNLEIVVPVSSRFADYHLRLMQIVEILAKCEERASAAVLRDLSLADVDLVRIRIPEINGDGSVPIDAGAMLVEQSRNMLLAAACSASRPQRAFRAGRNKEASDYIRTVRMGQTERGSFVINLLSPVPPTLQPPLTPEMRPPNMRDEPFPRRVTHKLASGLQATREAVGRSDIGAFEDGVPRGISANLCDAVAEMLGEGNEGGLDISISWALTRSHILEPAQLARVRFDASDAPVLKEASRILKDRQERPDEQIEGYVARLAHERSEHEGRVTIKATIDDRLLSVRVDFGPGDYSHVVDAHKRRQVISLEGDLRRDGQRWILENPRDLDVLEDDDE